jgi:hypothetical protein
MPITATPPASPSSKEPRVVETCRGTAHPLRIR